MPRRVGALVIGGGLIGLTAARELALIGADVLVVERGRLGCGASLGNGGLVPPSHSVPLNSPGVTRKALRWAFDPDSPFYVRPRLDGSLAAFLIRFALASRSRRLPAAVDAMRELNLLSARRLSQIVAELEGVALRREGLLNVYRSSRGFEVGKQEASLLAEHGVASTVLDAERLRHEEPLLVSPLMGGILWPGDGAVDPERLVRALAGDLVKRGVAFCEGVEVQELSNHGRAATVVRTSVGTVEADAVVIAAGSWSSRLARSLSRPFPLQPAKGYSVTISGPNATPRRPLLLSEAKVAVTPLDGRLRLAGTLELAGFDLGISRRRVAAIEQAGRSYLGPAVDGAATQTWAGLRALSGDGLPIVGPLPGHRSVLVATGHGHVGVGMAAGTGQLLAAMVAGYDPPIDPGPYRPARFRWGV